MNLFIIPGNPPALHFYELWAEEIQHKHSESAVCISTYPLLPSSRDSSKYLRDTAAAHGEKLLAFHKTVQKKIVVIGHSVGAWMALRLLEEYDAITESCLLLYPFLRQPSLKGKTILKSMQLLYKIPFTENLLLASRGVLEKISDDLRHVTDEELRTSLALSYHEQKVINRCKETLPIPKQHHKKLHMIYCDNDVWCPSQIVQEMKKWISCEKIDAKHGFITSAQERAVVLGSVFNYISS